MKEKLIVAVFLLFIIGMPPTTFKLYRYRKDKKYLRMLDMRIKNELISSESRGIIDSTVMGMVKGHIVKQRLIVCAITLAIFGYAALTWGLVYLLGAVPICGAVLTDMMYKLYKLRDASSLMKVKAFVFKSRRSDATAAYYDMKRLEYRTFTQNTFYVSGTKAEAGKYVNLIVRCSRNSYSPVMILNF